MIITFFGHADFSKTNQYKTTLLDFLEQHVGEAPVDFYLGGYGEFDRFAYDCCKQYKEKHPNASLIFVTPYMTAQYQRNDLKYQKQRHDAIIYPNIEDKPLKFAITYRNRWMVEQADYVICGISHCWGGAYQSYRYAKRKKKAVFNVTGKEF